MRGDGKMMTLLYVAVFAVLLIECVVLILMIKKIKDSYSHKEDRF